MLLHSEVLGSHNSNGALWELQVLSTCVRPGPLSIYNPIVRHSDTLTELINFTLKSSFSLEVGRIHVLGRGSQ